MKLRVCATCGMPFTVTSAKQRRCPTHSAADIKRSPSSRVTGTSQWRTLRTKILKRDKGTCQHCGKPATQVDHLDHVATGGTNAEHRLVASCAPCNQARKPPKGGGAG